MSAFDWVLIAWWIFGAVMSVLIIGKPRKPLDPSTVAVMVLITAALIAGLLISRGAL